MPTETIVRKVTGSIGVTGFEFPYKTILFNCNCHTFDEVEKQLMKAIHCTPAHAGELAWKVHSSGCAVVYSGPKEHCEAVASVLEDIRLIVKVSQ